MELFGERHDEMDDEPPSDGPDIQDWLVTHYMETEGMTEAEARQEIVDREARMRID